MKVTNVTVRKFERNNLLGFADIVLDEQLVIKGLKINKGQKGNFVGMPSSKGSDGNYYDIVFPITKELREEIQRKVLSEFGDTGSKHEDHDIEDDLPF